MSTYYKYTEARMILKDDGLWLQDKIENEESVFDTFDEFKLRRIYTYIRMFKIMHSMIHQDLSLIERFDKLFDALFDRYAIIAINREWTSKDFLGVKLVLRQIERIDERFTEYYDTLNKKNMDVDNDSVDEVYDDVRSDILKKLEDKEYEEMDKTYHPRNTKPFIGTTRPKCDYNKFLKNICECIDCQRHRMLQKSDLEDNEINTVKKVIDMSDRNEVVEMIIKMKSKTISISINDVL